MSMTSTNRIIVWLFPPPKHPVPAALGWETAHTGEDGALLFGRIGERCVETRLAELQALLDEADYEPDEVRIAVGPGPVRSGVLDWSIGKDDPAAPTFLYRPSKAEEQLRAVGAGKSLRAAAASLLEDLAETYAYVSPLNSAARAYDARPGKDVVGLHPFFSGDEGVTPRDPYEEQPYDIWLAMVRSCNFYCEVLSENTRADVFCVRGSQYATHYELTVGDRVVAALPETFLDGLSNSVLYTQAEALDIVEKQARKGLGEHQELPCCRPNPEKTLEVLQRVNEMSIPDTATKKDREYVQAVVAAVWERLAGLDSRVVVIPAMGPTEVIFAENHGPELHQYCVTMRSASGRLPMADRSGDLDAAVREDAERIAGAILGEVSVALQAAGPETLVYLALYTVAAPWNGGVWRTRLAIAGHEPRPMERAS